MFVDADWVGSWTEVASHDLSGVHSCTGFLITNAGCHVAWGSNA